MADCIYEYLVKDGSIIWYRNDTDLVRPGTEYYIRSFQRREAHLWHLTEF